LIADLSTPSGTLMKFTGLLCLALLIVGCNTRSESDSIGHGMKWSIAQRDLEQHGWISTASKPTRISIPADGKAYRYLNTQGMTVDIITEKIGDIEKIYRIFDVDGKEMDGVMYKSVAGK
jgi:hypothetical protein